MSVYSGRDHWRCIYGGQWSSCPQWKSPLCRNRQCLPGLAEYGHKLQDQTPSSSAACPENWLIPWILSILPALSTSYHEWYFHCRSAFRAHSGWSGRAYDAKILFIWWHSQQSFYNGVHWKTWDPSSPHTPWIEQLCCSDTELFLCWE